MINWAHKIITHSQMSPKIKAQSRQLDHWKSIKIQTLETQVNLRTSNITQKIWNVQWLKRLVNH
jgi:hypothetical protein